MPTFFLCAEDLNHESEINIMAFQDVIPRVAIFRRNPLPSSVLKMEVADFSENLSSSVSAQNTRVLQAVQLCCCTVHDSSCRSVLFYSVFPKLYIIIIKDSGEFSFTFRQSAVPGSVWYPVDRKLS